MKTSFFLLTLFLLIGCKTSFSHYSSYNAIENCNENETNYVCILNDSLKMKYVSFGGFRFAKNNLEFNKLNAKKPKFKNIVIYGRSDIINTEYYILLDNHRKKKGFSYKDTIINSNHLTIAVTNSAQVTNKKFLLKGLK